MATGRENLFDAVLVKDLMNKVKGKSSLAVLSGQTPIPFNGLKEFIFSMDNEIDIVAENGKKVRGRHYCRSGKNRTDQIRVRSESLGRIFVRDRRGTA